MHRIDFLQYHSHTFINLNAWTTNIDFNTKSEGTEKSLENEPDTFIRKSNF